MALLSGADACLAFEDGRVFYGHAFGAWNPDQHPLDVNEGGDRHAFVQGEVVFNTSMAGYQEIATDPSYRGQMVVLTYPQIGNYGIQGEASESTCPWLTALIVRDLARAPNHWLMTEDLSHFLSEAGIPGIHGVDTRALTRHLRAHGTLRAVLGRLDGDQPTAEQVGRLVSLARAVPALSDQNLVADVSNPAGAYAPTERWVETVARYSSTRIAVIDCGIKHNIARSLTARGAETRFLSWTSGIDEVMATEAQGVIFSNGPGDPARMHQVAQLASQLLDREVPLLGICLGHQVLGLAAGGSTSRLGYGHHGGNHPVQDVTTGRVHITTQNHEFQVDRGSIPDSSGFGVSMVHLNDSSVEGLAHRSLPAFSVQFHPEGCPGPQDNQYIFERFLDMVDRPVSGWEALERSPASAAQADLSEPPHGLIQA
ncbi:MAG: carbamoyl-phosphate synthase small subunit [Chloroflexi bacterium]|nr:carbamoyl-phosphate synthase small subunit [Chloroflexota bacterium]